MNTENAINAACAATVRSLNALLDRELPEPQAGEVTEHLSKCESCSRELQLRQQMRARLKAAVASQQPSPYLRSRVLSNVRAQSRKPGWLQRTSLLGASAAAVVVLMAGAAGYQLGHLRLSVNSQNAYISSLVQRVSNVMRPGLSDHVHCSVYRKYPKQPPSVETLHRHIGPEYKHLVDAVSAKLPSDYRAFIAHECGYNGRRFVHVGLKGSSNLVSLVLARKLPGETFRDSGLLPVISGGGLAIYGQSAQRFHIAGFETGTHLAYIVSDTSDRHVRELLLALAPDIERAIGASKA